MIFWMPFLLEKICCFWFRSQRIVLLRIQFTIKKNGADNAMVPNRQRVIIWTSEPVASPSMHIYVSPASVCSMVMMMMSSNRNIFHVTGHLCGEFTGPRWIPRTKASDAELWRFLICTRINGWVNNGEAGDLRRHHAHYDVTVMAVMQE